MNDDLDLLRRYVTEKSEEAFAALVRQHLGLVYHTALRHLHGDTHAAEDVAQSVFTDLARKAESLADRPMLAGWLHTSARYAALQHLRSARRRQTREQEAQLMQETNQAKESPIAWDQLRGVIDEALQVLKERDREAVLLRFFEGRDFEEVGRRLNLSPQGARSCVERALAKMQARLTRRGVNSTLAVLSSALAAHAAAEAPATLAASIARTAVVDAAIQAAGAGGTGIAAGVVDIMKVSSLLLTGSLAANVAFGVLWLGGDGAPRPAAAIPMATVTAAALASERQPAVTALTDPVQIGRRLQAAGFSDKVVTSAAYLAVSLEMRDGVQAAGNNHQARIRRWNPSPQSSVEVAPGLMPPEPVRPGESPYELRRNAVYTELGYDTTGASFASLYRNLSAEKAKLVRRIEEDYKAIREAGTTRIGNTTQTTRATMNEIVTQFDRDIRAVLTPAEATDYFRYHSEATRQEQAVLSSFPMSDAAYAEIADAALEVARLRRQGADEEAFHTALMAQLAAYRRGLGDENLLRALRRLPGSQFAEADAIYQQAEIPAATRADLYFTFIRISARGRQDRTTTGAQLYTALTTGAGLTAEQIAAFDATRFGQQLKRAASSR